MATNNEIHVDDVGTEFLATIVDFDDLDGNGDPTPIDISSATIMTLTFAKADAVVEVHTASFTLAGSGGTGDGTDGKISYFTVLGDLDVVGGYKLQGEVTTPAGNWSSTIEKFKVIGNL